MLGNITFIAKIVLYSYLYKALLYIGLQEFLNTSATALQTEFDKMCGFFNINKLLCKHSVKAARDTEVLCSLAREFCGIATYSARVSGV